MKGADKRGQIGSQEFHPHWTEISMPTPHGINGHHRATELLLPPSNEVPTPLPRWDDVKGDLLVNQDFDLTQQ